MQLKFQRKKMKQINEFRALIVQDVKICTSNLKKKQENFK